MLRPISSPIKNAPFTIYDLEWYPKTYKVRMVGVRDEHGYRSYLTVDDFLNSEMTHDNRGRTFYAHAGGHFDVQHILEVIARSQRFGVQACFSGASAVLVHVSDGRNKWTFADSYFLMRDSLKKIGKTVGLEKLECAFDAPIAQLREYNERDCEIPWRGIHMLKDAVESLGGELRPTIASCAMRLFLRAFLKEQIPTSPHINEILRASYCASRCEVFAHHAPEAEYFDINSSFPYSMTRPQPGKLLRIRPDIPKGEHALYFAHADVTVPPMYLPPLPYKMGSRIFFPTGSWQGWFTEEDLHLLESVGGSIDRVFRVY